MSTRHPLAFEMSDTADIADWQPGAGRGHFGNAKAGTGALAGAISRLNALSFQTNARQWNR